VQVGENRTTSTGKQNKQQSTFNDGWQCISLTATSGSQLATCVVENNQSQSVRALGKRNKTNNQPDS